MMRSWHAAWETLDMSRKVAIVTGAASGMGKATALIFARDGVDVLLADRNEAGGLETEADARALGVHAVFHETDVSAADSVQSMVDRAVSEFGGFDYAANVAGISSESEPLAELEDAVFDRIIGVNLKSVFLCMRAEIRQLRAQGRGGAIVNFGSLNAQKAFPRKSVYGASKAGVVAMTANAAVDYAAEGIRINAVLPGRIETPMLLDTMSRPGRDLAALRLDQPIRRLGRPEEVGEAAVWLCSEKASFVVGHALLVDGGYLAG